MDFIILGDGKLEREHAEGDVELYLPGSLCCHVLHTGGEHQVCSRETKTRTKKEKDKNKDPAQYVVMFSILEGNTRYVVERQRQM